MRALIIDKDKSPRWQQATIEQVQQELVQSFFATRPKSKPALRQAAEPDERIR
ncbi:3-hydroxyisobutyryl-CoA hydrolase [compost metagenome]